MTKIIINTEYGEFHVTPQIYDWINEQTGELPSDEELNKLVREHYKAESDDFFEAAIDYEKESYFWEEKWRTDELLIEAVEKFKPSNLKIVEVPSDIDWEIDYGVGAEMIIEKNKREMVLSDLILTYLLQKKDIEATKNEIVNTFSNNIHSIDNSSTIKDIYFGEYIEFKVYNDKMIELHEKFSKKTNFDCIYFKQDCALFRSKNINQEFLKIQKKVAGRLKNTADFLSIDFSCEDLWHPYFNVYLNEELSEEKTEELYFNIYNMFVEQTPNEYYNILTHMSVKIRVI